jgi:hypothetical protein
VHYTMRRKMSEKKLTFNRYLKVFLGSKVLARSSVWRRSEQKITIWLATGSTSRSASEMNPASFIKASYFPSLSRHMSEQEQRPN